MCQNRTQKKFAGGLTFVSRFGKVGELDSGAAKTPGTAAVSKRQTYVARAMLNRMYGLTGSTVAPNYRILPPMANPHTKAQGRGKRGGNSDKPRERSGYPNGHPASYAPSTKVSTGTAIVADVCGPIWELVEVDEEADTHIVPRKSQTTKSNLRVFPPEVIREDVKERQLFWNGERCCSLSQIHKWVPKDNGEYACANARCRVIARMIETTSQRVVSVSPTTLLITGKPDTLASALRKLKRKTSRTGRIDYREDLPIGDSEMVTVEDPRYLLELPAPVFALEPSYVRCPKCERTKQVGARCMCGNTLDTLPPKASQTRR